MLFDMGTMEWLADHRNPALTVFALAASGLGEVQGYLAITTLIYVAFDKRLAIRLALVATLAMCANHLLKIVIQNPRPFIAEGDYLAKWAVPLDNARDLATEWSTPSGHAMAGASFYAFLYGCVRNRYLRFVAVLAILLTGLSRPYLGVHYIGDILLGWPIGLALALVALRYGDAIAIAWSRLAYARQVCVAVAASLALWLATIIVNDGQYDEQPRAFLAYAGIVTGIVAAWPLEQRFVDFDARGGGPALKLLRYLLAILLSLAVMEILKRWFGVMAGDYSLGGYALQYLRYIFVSLTSLFVAPWIFVRLKLADGCSPREAVLL